MTKQYPSKVLKIEEVSNAEYWNSETYVHYLTRLMLMCTSLFEWTGLPQGMPERYLEKVLFNDGQLAFVNDSSYGIIATKCSSYQSFNFYNEPISWLCYSDNGYYKNFNTNDIEIVRNNKYSFSTRYLIEHHIQRLFNIERTIDKNLWYQRNMVILKSSDSTRLTMSNLVDQYDKNNLLIYGHEDLDLKDNIDKLDFNIPFIADKLEDIKDRKWQELINMLGINSANTQKKERLITDEANANNQLIDLSVDIMLAERKLAVEAINKRWGLNIEVKLRNEKKEEPQEEGEE